MSAPQKQRKRAEEIPADTRSELVEGEVVVEVRPPGEHQVVVIGVDVEGVPSVGHDDQCCSCLKTLANLFCSGVQSVQTRRSGRPRGTSRRNAAGMHYGDSGRRSVIRDELDRKY